SGTTQLTITPQNGFTGTVNLSLVDGSGNSVPGITLDPPSVNVTGSGPVTQDLTVNVATSVAPNTYNLQLRATSGSLTKTAGLSLTVMATWTPRTSGTRNWLYGVTYGNGLFVAGGMNRTILTSSDGVTWTPQRTPETGYTFSLNDVTYGNGLFVAVGDFGTILTSPDGVNWTQRTSGTSYSLRGVAYGNGLFVAVGDFDTILTSPDGVSWTPQRTPVTGSIFYLYNVTYGNGLFVAVGGTGAILTSPDGVSWTPQTSGTGNTLYGVTYGNGRFVAVGMYGTILTSP
ncbi:WD40/YVTN/BNR-like repeat-containing protein, partial [Thermus sp.]|uniref:WD40/YVTN/BNR-like repeat-containing protein n=1 Tax=Thermus sp. TaxID=275 RepID=UPI0028CC9D50|nr:hypothetical protein [Thermus sp.]